MLRSQNTTCVLTKQDHQFRPRMATHVHLGEFDFLLQARKNLEDLDKSFEKERTQGDPY